MTAVAHGPREQVDVGADLVLSRSQSLWSSSAAAALGLLLQSEATLRCSSNQTLNEVVVFRSVHILVGAQSLRGSSPSRHCTVERTLERVGSGEVGPRGVESLVLGALVLAGGISDELLPLRRHLEEGLALHVTGLGDGVQALQVPDGELRKHLALKVVGVGGAVVLLLVLLLPAGGGSSHVTAGNRRADLHRFHGDRWVGVPPRLVDGHAHHLRPLLVRLVEHGRLLLLHCSCWLLSQVRVAVVWNKRFVFR